MPKKSEETKRKEAALPLEEARRLFDYDPETGLLTRKVSTSNCVKVGDIGRSKGTSGYLRVMVYGNRYLAHRLIWYIYHGKWPDQEIDHINRNKTDNRICNLRDVDRIQNKRNTGKRKNNTSGVIGVHFNKKLGKWQAAITYGVSRSYLGVFDSLEDAKRAVEEARAKHWKTYSNQDGGLI